MHFTQIFDKTRKKVENLITFNSQKILLSFFFWKIFFGRNITVFSSIITAVKIRLLWAWIETVYLPALA